MADRDEHGRFLPGCKPGPGRPRKRYSAVELRKAVLKAVTPEEVAAIVRALLSRAMDGDVAAAREVLNRVLGPPIEADLLERLERLERAIHEQISR
ncbi:MAG: DUF5681 domain-containing protein [Thermogutta sp.]|jgi:hypothetical protein